MTATTAPVKPGTIHAKRRKLAIAAGTWQPYVDPARAIAHVAALRAQRMSPDAIAAAAHVGEATVARLAYPGRGVAPIRWGIRARTEAAILRVTVFDAPDTSWVPALGTSRRLQALAAIGWSNRDLADRLGLTRECVQHWNTAERVSARNHRRVVGLYAALSMTPGPSARSRAYARRAGWAPPLAWDDDRLDDPTATPDFGDEHGDGVDDAVIARVLDGEPHHTTIAEREVLVPVLHGRGLNDTEIAQLLGVVPETVLRLRKRLRIGGRYAA